MGEIKSLTLFALIIGFVLNLVFVHLFYSMLSYGSPIISVDANNYGEYWFEFIILQVCLVVIGIAFVVESVKYWKYDENKFTTKKGEVWIKL